MRVTAFYTAYGVPSTGLSPVVNIRRSDTGAIIVAAGAMNDRGGGWYDYDFAAYDPSNPYSIRCDGGSDLLDARYTYGGNVIDTAEARDTFEMAGELLDLLENKLTIDEVNSVLELWDDAGINVIKRWPIRDKTHIGATVTLVNLPTTVPVDRYPRTL